MGGSVGCLALLPAPRAARCRSLGADGLSGRGGICWPQGQPLSGLQGCPATAPAALAFSHRCSASDGLSQAEWHQHRLQRLHRGQQGEPGGRPLPGGEQEELSPLSSKMSFPEAPNCCGRGVSSAEMLGASRRSAWEPSASEGFANPSPGCCGLGPALSCPGMVWIF